MAEIKTMETIVAELEALLIEDGDEEEICQRMDELENLIDGSDEEPREANQSKEHLLSLVKSLPCSSLAEENIVVKEIAMLCGGFSDLVDVFEQMSYSDADLHFYMLAIVYHISINEKHKSTILQGGCPEAMPFLMQSLRSQNTEINIYAAAALSKLSSLDLNKRIIGESGAIKDFIEFVKKGGPSNLRSATNALINVCTLAENREQVVSAGVVIVVMDKIISRIHLEEMLHILVLLSSHEGAIAEMQENTGMLMCLFTIMREDVSEKIKEDCMTLVHNLYYFDVTKTNKIKEVVKARETLELVASTGTSTSRLKARELLLQLHLD